MQRVNNLAVVLWCLAATASFAGEGTLAFTALLTTHLQSVVWGEILASDRTFVVMVDQYVNSEAISCT